MNFIFVKMPVGRHRKPFSTKQKKEQLQAKRELKRNKGIYLDLFIKKRV